MKKIVLITQNSILVDKIMESFSTNHEVEVHIFNKVSDIINSWDSLNPIISIVDIHTPEIDASVFIDNVSIFTDVLYSSNRFIFLSGTDSPSVKNAKQAIEKVRYGTLVIKNINQDEPENFEEVIKTIQHNYSVLLSEQRKNSGTGISTEHLNENIYNNPQPVILKLKNHKIELIVIGISTGGPSVLRKLIPEIQNLSLPLVIVQHMIPDFIDSYIKTLSLTTKIPISIANQGDILEKNHIYFAPDHSHLKISNIDGNLSILLDHSPSIKGYIPSIEATYESLVKENISCLGVLMSGIGNDGVSNLKLLKDAGNPTIAQSPDDSVAFGMPQSLIKINGADSILKISAIADIFNSI